jgi:hypothetical protein
MTIIQQKRHVLSSQVFTHPFKQYFEKKKFLKHYKIKFSSKQF